MLDELEAGALLDRLGIARAPSVALDAGLREAPCPALCLSGRRQSPVAPKSRTRPMSAAWCSTCVMAKRSSPRFDRSAPRWRNIIRVAPVERVLVQPMVSGLGEVLIGYRIDRDVGPLVLVAAGGVLTEIERDRSLRLAPVDLATAHEMIAEVRGLKVFTGYRGKPKGDLDALARAIVALSGLAHEPTSRKLRSIR